MSSIMWKYIDQEPQVLAGILQDTAMDKALDALGPGLEAIYFVAHGSSYNAATAAASFIGRQSGLRTYAYTPANFLYNCQALAQEERAKALVVAISQTGTSRGVIQALERAKEMGFETLGLTDVAGSPIHVKSDTTIFLGCGEEDSNAKTKGYSATLLQLLRLGIKLGLGRKVISQGQYQGVCNELQGQIEALAGLRDKILAWCQAGDLAGRVKDLYVLGYGMNFGTAMEGQLKLMETMCMPTMFNDLEEFSHGMHRAIQGDSTVLLLRTPHTLSPLALDTYRYLQGKAGRVLLIDATGEAPEGALNLPWYPETESLLLITLAIQILSVWLPEQNGLDPNRDANNDYTDFVHTRI